MDFKTRTSPCSCSRTEMGIVDKVGHKVASRAAPFFEFCTVIKRTIFTLAILFITEMSVVKSFIPFQDAYVTIALIL